MSEKKFEILPVRVERKVPVGWEKVDKRLPIHQFCMAILAPPRSGKSNLIQNLLYNPQFDFANKFDKVVIISPSIENDQTMKFAMEDDDIAKFYEPEMLDNMDELVKEIIEAQKKEPEQQTLLILDDCLGKLKGKQLANLCSRYRHFNLSMILVSQTFKGFDVATRNCASHWIMFRSFNEQEQKKIGEEFNSFPDFLQHYYHATDEKYHFLYVDVNNQRLMKDFNDVLYQK